MTLVSASLTKPKYFSPKILDIKTGLLSCPELEISSCSIRKTFSRFAPLPLSISYVILASSSNSSLDNSVMTDNSLSAETAGSTARQNPVKKDRTRLQNNLMKFCEKWKRCIAEIHDRSYNNSRCIQLYALMKVLFLVPECLKNFSPRSSPDLTRWA